MKKIIILFAAVFIAACSSNKEAGSKAEIAVSILPEQYFLEKITGDFFKINVMIPPGASPATYEPTPSQIASIAGTDMYLKMGYTGFEMAWMDKLSSSNKNMQIINLSEGIALITEESAQSKNETDHGHHHGGIDPHTWLSPANVKIISQNIYNALANKYPEKKEEFAENLTTFLQEIDSLDRYISNELSDLDSRAFFTYHPSLSYFARDYHLEQFPLELGGKEPSTGHMKYLIDMGKEQKIGVVFLQMQFDQKNAEVLASEIDAEIVQINPLDEAWYEQMLFITDKLKQNLK